MTSIMETTRQTRSSRRSAAERIVSHAFDYALGAGADAAKPAAAWLASTQATHLAGNALAHPSLAMRVQTGSPEWPVRTNSIGSNDASRVHDPSRPILKAAKLHDIDTAVENRQRPKPYDLM
jgi:hypothetical protein